jgi:hypothetical protein
MKIHKNKIQVFRNRFSKPLLVLILVVICISTYLILQAYRNSLTQQKAIVNEGTFQNTAETLDDSETLNSQKNTDGKGTDTPKSDKIVGITTAHSNGNQFQIRAIIKETTSTGTCRLKMESSRGESYSATADTQPMASTSTCKGFDVNLSSLSKGQWIVTVTYISSDNTESSDSREVTINA